MDWTAGQAEIGDSTIMTVLDQRPVPVARFSRVMPIGALIAIGVLLSACGGSSAVSKANAFNEPVTPSIKTVALGTGTANLACQLLSRTGVAEVFGLKVPGVMDPYKWPADEDPSEEVPSCSLDEVNVQLEEITLKHGECIFRPIDEVRVSGHVACIELDENLPDDPDYNIEVSMSYHGQTDATISYYPAHNGDHATLRKQLIQLATNLIAATK
jgi:hypothetical protein